MKLIFKKLFVMVAVIGAIFLLASCSKKTYSLELPEHVTANVESYNAIKNNALVTLTITVPEGQELISLKVNGEEVEVANNRYSFRIKQNTVVTVTFTELENRYSLTLPSGVTADVSSFTDILEDTPITLTVLPPANKRLETLKVNDATVVVTNNKYTFNITQNTVVTVVFVDLTPVTTTYILNLPEGVVSNQNDDFAVSANTSVTLTITPPANHILNQLLINGTPVAVTNNQYTFVMTEETDVSVSFTEIPPTVTTYSLTLPPTVTAPDITNLNEIPEGTTIVLTITPPEGKVIDSFKVNGNEVAVVGNAHQFDITGNTVITVTYKDRAGEVNWEEVNPVMNAMIISGFNYEIYREGTFDFTSIVTENETVLTSTFLYRYNNKLDMTNGYIRREHAPTFVEEVLINPMFILKTQYTTFTVMWLALIEPFNCGI
ncbi:MAG: hypothetical protein WC225_04825 [Acholeplasmataceae bacterium]|nr:hypothetical protein [Acholeplasmataceae bacterium]